MINHWAFIGIYGDPVSSAPWLGNPCGHSWAMGKSSRPIIASGSSSGMFVYKRLLRMFIQVTQTSKFEVCENL
jgi:hypothetical protein